MQEQTMTFPNLFWPVQQWAKSLATVHHSMEAAQHVALGFSKYSTDFLRSYLTSMSYWTEIERRKSWSMNPWTTFVDYTRLGGMNLELFFHALTGSAKLANALAELEGGKVADAIVNTILGGDGEDLEAFMERQAAVARMVAKDYPEAIEAIEKEYGFHFERYGEGPFAETDHFVLWRVRPTDPSVEDQPGRKPLIIIPPYVLGANVLAFLPEEQRSYAHSFANQGIPTYIRVMKDIHEHEAVQLMVGEDDTRGTRFFCERVMEAHGLPVTLNGYCQGGFSALANVLTGELDGLVDTLITCVSPMDGTRSSGLSGFLSGLPERFNDLEYGTKVLPSGNRVADGRLMGWVYKLKSIDAENPFSVYYRDLLMFARQGKKEMKLNKSAVAINYWLANERTDLPLAITNMSFASYNTPFTKDGVLPVRLFDRELNLHRLEEKGIRWQICYGEKDDLVEKECALAPLDYVKAEVAEFPRGHVAIATSWSHPESACALHKRFGKNGQYRGPVRFQLDVEEELMRSGRRPKPAPRGSSEPPATKESAATAPPATKRSAAKAPTVTKRTTKKKSRAKEKKAAKS